MLREAWKDEGGGPCSGGGGGLPSFHVASRVFSVPTYSVQVTSLDADWPSVGTAGLSVHQLCERAPKLLGRKQHLYLRTVAIIMLGSIVRIKQPEIPYSKEQGRLHPHRCNS